jgi:hypothetical protein
MVGEGREERGSHLLTQQGLPQLRDLLADLSLEAEESLFELFLSQSLLLLPREEEAGVVMRWGGWRQHSQSGEEEGQSRGSRADRHPPEAQSSEGRLRGGEIHERLTWEREGWGARGDSCGSSF